MVTGEAVTIEPQIPDDLTNAVIKALWDRCIYSRLVEQRQPAYDVLVEALVTLSNMDVAPELGPSMYVGQREDEPPVGPQTWP